MPGNERKAKEYFAGLASEYAARGTLGVTASFISTFVNPNVDLKDEECEILFRLLLPEMHKKDQMYGRQVRSVAVPNYELGMLICIMLNTRS